MTKKIIVLFLFLISNIFVNQVVKAVMAAPSPTCEIIAKVIKVERFGTNTQEINDDYIQVILDILDISTYQQEGQMSCNKEYIERAEKYTQTIYGKEYDKNPFSQGQKIKGKVHFQGDERWHAISLWDVEILDNINNKSINLVVAIATVLIIILIISIASKKRKNT